MRIRSFCTKAVVGVIISLLTLQSILAAPLLVAADRPERTNDRGLSTFAQVVPVPRPRIDSEAAIHLTGTLSHEAAQNRQPASRAVVDALGSALDPIESGYPALALDPVRAADPANAGTSDKTATTHKEAAQPNPGTEPRVVNGNPESGYFTGRNASGLGRDPVNSTGEVEHSPEPTATAAGANPGGNAEAVSVSAHAHVATDTQGSLPLKPKQGQEGPEVFTEDVRMNNLIKQYMNIYTSPSGINWLKIVLKRAAPFRDYIASRIQHYHMPPELLYLPMVESTYNPYAVSRSGAAGLWQFMTNSVYPYGLQINEWMDERFDFWRSTDASLEKLKYNYDQLGDWLLALAAYNVGLNYVQQVVRKTGIHDVWELGAKGYLPYETMVYIPKFLAIAAVCSYPGRYGLPVEWDNPIHWTRIKLDQAVDLRILAREAGVNESLLLEGNAELRYYITPPGDSNYYLKVPQRDSNVVEQVLKRQKFHLMRFYIYTVQTGDTLYDLSLYYGVPISMILQYNPRASARYLQIGEHLVIPGLKNVPPYSRSAAANLQPRGPKITLHDPSGRFTGLYTVRPGDSLWAISKQFGITPAELAKVNGITESTIIRDGIVLHVPGPGALITEGAN